MGRKKKFYIASIIGLILVITYLHYSTDYRNPVHEIYSEFHYVPVLIGALAFGVPKERAGILVDARNPTCDLEVDGGIDAATAPLAVGAGANVLVAGTAVFGESEGVATAVKRLKATIEGSVR